jgi:hypothetical protein
LTFIKLSQANLKNILFFVANKNLLIYFVNAKPKGLFRSKYFSPNHGPNQARPSQKNRPKQKKSQTKSGQTKSGQTKPGQAKPGRPRPGAAETKAFGPKGLWPPWADQLILPPEVFKVQTQKKIIPRNILFLSIICFLIDIKVRSVKVFMILDIKKLHLV